MMKKDIKITSPVLNIIPNQIYKLLSLLLVKWKNKVHLDHFMPPFLPPGVSQGDHKKIETNLLCSAVITIHVKRTNLSIYSYFVDQMHRTLLKIAIWGSIAPNFDPLWCAKENHPPISL